MTTRKFFTIYFHEGMPPLSLSRKKFFIRKAILYFGGYLKGVFHCRTHKKYGKNKGSINTNECNNLNNAPLKIWFQEIRQRIFQ